MAARILLRTDGGAGIGLGHLQRCLSLATALQRNGALSFFLLHGDDDAVAKIAEAGFAGGPTGAAPGSVDDIDATIAEAQRLECDAVIVDSYLTGGAMPGAIRDAGFYTVAIDDLNAHPFECHMVVSFGPHAAGYVAARDDIRFLLGPAYTILRKEYWDVPLMPVRDRVRNILVTTGGADPGGVMPEWIRAIDDIDAPFDVTAIVGPFFADPDAVHDAAAGAQRMVRVVTAPKVTRPMQAMADIAVSAAGQTLYELAALGVPTIAAEIAANQRPQLSAFAEAGAMIDAGATSDPATTGRIVSAVARLIDDADQRRALSQTARGAVDRRGALTVAAEVLAAIAAHRKDSP